MKKVIPAVLIMAALFVVSCGGNEKDEETKEGEGTEQAAEEEEEKGPSIVGTWQCTGMDMGMEIPEAQKAMFDEMIAAMSYTFTEDGKMTAKAKIGKENSTETGTYKVEDNKIVVSKDGDSDSIDIESLTEDELVLAMEDRGTKMTMTFKRK